MEELLPSSYGYEQKLISWENNVCKIDEILKRCSCRTVALRKKKFVDRRRATAPPIVKTVYLLGRKSCARFGFNYVPQTKFGKILFLLCFLSLRSSVFNGRTYCYFPIIFQRKILLLLYCFFFPIFFSYRFCAEDFSKSVGSISGLR